MSWWPAVSCLWKTVCTIESRSKEIKPKAPDKASFYDYPPQGIHVHVSTVEDLKGHLSSTCFSLFLEVLDGEGAPIVVLLAGTTGPAAANAKALWGLRLLPLAGDWCSKANSLEVFLVWGALHCGNSALLGLELDGEMCVSVSSSAKECLPRELLRGRNCAWLGTTGVGIIRALGRWLWSNIASSSVSAASVRNGGGRVLLRLLQDSQHSLL